MYMYARIGSPGRPLGAGKIIVGGAPKSDRVSQSGGGSASVFSVVHTEAWPHPLTSSRGMGGGASARSGAARSGGSEQREGTQTQGHLWSSSRLFLGGTLVARHGHWTQQAPLRNLRNAKIALGLSILAVRRGPRIVRSSCYWLPHSSKLCKVALVARQPIGLFETRALADS